MSPQDIAEVEKKHPEEFARRRASGLDLATVARLVLEQAAHDAAHPPWIEMRAKARSLCELARARFEQLKALFAEARAAVDAVALANPDLPGSELPELPPLIVDSDSEARTADSKLAKELTDLKDDLLKLQALDSQKTKTLNERGEMIAGLEQRLEAKAKELEAVNEEYQAKVAQIADLGSQVSSLKAKVVELEAVNEEYQAKVAQIADLESQVSSLKAKVVELEAQLKAKKR